MKRSLIQLGAIAFAVIGQAQVITVVGTGDPRVDVPAVQAAVDQGGRIVLKGHFSFDASPTASSGSCASMILVSNAVAISGMPDDHGEMTTIEGGSYPFCVDALGARGAIEGLHFIRPKYQAIHVGAVSGLVIASNRIEGVVTDTGTAIGIGMNTSLTGTPSATDLGRGEYISGTVVIANNDIDMQGVAGANFLAMTAFSLGKSPDHEVDLHVTGNNIRNVTERPINIYPVGGRAYVERNVITTGTILGTVTP